MARNISVHVDPYDGQSESNVTSDVIDLRDADDYTLSVRTTSGTTSAYTYQVSNATGRIQTAGNIPESSWSNAISADIPTSTDLLDDLPLAVRWGRVLRETSGSSLVFDLNKQVGVE